MDEKTPATPADRRPWWIAGAALAAVIAVVVGIAVVVVGVAWFGGDDADDGDEGDSDAGGAVTMSTDVPPPPGDAVTTTIDPSAPTTESASDATDTTPVSTAPASTGSTGSAVTAPLITGSLDTVVVGAVVPAPPVSMDDVADAGTGMTFRVEQLEAVQGEAAGPGEIAAPAVRVTIVATNGGTQPVSMESVVVDLTSGDDEASSPPLSGPGVERFAGEVAPGASVTGVYVFDVPIDRRDRVSILVSYLASVSPVVFEGAAPTR